MAVEHYDFYSDTSIPMMLLDKEKQYTAEQALDLIKETYYPDMKQVFFEADSNIFGVRESLLKYVQSGYYYEDEQGNVLYYMYMDLYVGEVRHTIYCKGENVEYKLIDKDSDVPDVKISENFY